MNSIKVKNLSKTFKDFKLNNINFTLPSGTIMGLVGENGAGKSTIIKLIMNAVKADSGDVMVLGKSNLSKEFIDVKQDVGVVLDEAYFPELLTAKNISAIMQQTYKNWSEETYNVYLEKFSLPLNQKFKDYSRGMKMKLAISVALSHSAKLLILDEATSGLDITVRDEILNVFNNFTRDENCSVLLSSHIVSDLEKICDYITFIRNGELVLTEEKDHLMQSYRIVKLPENQLEDLPKEAIIRKKKTGFGYEVLVEKEKINSSFQFEHTSLEDIILFMGKEMG